MKKIIISLIFLFLPAFVFADDLAQTCQQLTSSDLSCQNISSADCRSLLEQCASYYDSQSAKISEDLTKTKAQKDTLQNQISSLKKKIGSLESKIAQGTLMVKGLNLQINDTQLSINKTVQNLQESQSQIANILRAVHQEDKKPAFLVLFEGDLSDYFSNIAYLETLNSKVSDMLESTQNLKSYLEEQKNKQEEEKGQLQKTIQIQSLQKKENEQNKKQQDSYLKLTEAQYQQQLKDKAAAEKNANAIKARIFDLIGVSNAPNFGEAVKIAKYVSGITGVRPAFLLAILTQESNLGKNVGQCYVTDFTTGNGVNAKGVAKSRVMSPKTIPSFVDLTQSLGMEPTKTPVSCWIPLYSSGVPYGWGGAMGPAQFIASTWSIYSPKVTEITGKPANPWNINDAFLASGLLLKSNGALSSESNAAAKYYCGGSFNRYECKAYASSVLRYATQYESDIKAIGE